ncbi:MFS transporter [Winslowiella iniecta]|uniref:MFS transporter n=1 Tax=Winslowiella iniecta TaxID=1560201 RepID=A0A0L7T9A9_9GAMM|nr:MFS transporter [Winslowiella iniecta]KOC91959.1 MFS transporter [Winslowiella iniecta]KOC94919.1 MFS transporter [Winslowiella iniecta]
MTTRLFSLLFLVLTADGLMVFLTPVVVYMLTGSLAYSGLSYAIWWLPRLILIPLIGKYIDNTGVRPLSIISDCIKVAGCLLLIFSNFTDPLTVAIAFGAVGSLISIGNSQTMIAYEKLIATLSVQREHHVNLMARMDFLGMIIGPIVGMLLIDYGYKNLLLIPCVFYLINAWYFFRAADQLNTVQLSESSSTAPEQQPFNRFIALRFILSTPLVLAIIGLALGNNMFDGLVESSGTALIDKNMQLPVKYFGLIDVAAGVCGVVGTYVYGAMLTMLSRRLLLSFGLVMIVIPSLLLIFHTSSLTIFILCYALTIIGKVITGNINRIIRIEIIPTSILASASSLVVLFCQSILPVVGFTLFLLAGNNGAVHYLMLCAVLISLLSGLLLLMLFRPEATAR